MLERLETDTSREASFDRPATVSCLLVLALTATLVMVQIFSDHSGVYFLYLLMIAQLAPFAIAFTRRRFTFLAFVMLFHFLTFSITKWIQFRQHASGDSGMVEVVRAIQEQIFCSILLIAGYSAMRFFFSRGPRGSDQYELLPLNPGQMLLLGTYVVFGPVIADYLPTWYYAVHFTMMTGAVLLLFTSRCAAAPFLASLVKVAAVLSAFRYFLHSGMMTLIGTLVSFLFLASCLEKKYLRIFLLLAGVVFASAVQTVKGDFRKVIRESPELTTWARLGVLTELLQAKYLDEAESSEEAVEEKSDQLLMGFSRVGDDSLERVLSMTPSKVPFWNGETYATIPYMFIPRALWPGKPARDFWNKYGRTYEVLSGDDYQTSVGISFLAEGYMNFGYTGMYAIALLVGILIALVESTVPAMLGGRYSFTFLLLLSPLLIPSNDLGSMLQSLWTIYLFTVLARFMLLRIARKDAYS